MVPAARSDTAPLFRELPKEWGAWTNSGLKSQCTKSHLLRRNLVVRIPHSAVGCEAVELIFGCYLPPPLPSFLMLPLTRNGREEFWGMEMKKSLPSKPSQISEISKYLYSITFVLEQNWICTGGAHRTWEGQESYCLCVLRPTPQAWCPVIFFFLKEATELFWGAFRRESFI